MKISELQDKAIDFLKSIIGIPSYSTEEHAVADFTEKYLKAAQVKVFRKRNNVWAVHPKNCENKKTILLNSHLDTVKPNHSWTYAPHEATEISETIYGLGSNDAGASVTAQMHSFLYLCELELPFNLIYSATAEEENSGENGVEIIFNELGIIDLAIVGEPTQMQMAVAERGLLVLDCSVVGKAGHAARNEGINAIYEALPAIDWFRTYEFEKKSDLLGGVKMTVTEILAGKQHNVVPDLCSFVTDVRFHEGYSAAEVFEIIRKNVPCEVVPRSLRLNSSSVPLNHPIVKRGTEIGLTYYGSPTGSDQCVMNFASIKIGPGDSARSHTADEYIRKSEIREGIEIYIKLLKDLII